jgi:hypothetical protein
LGGWAVVGHFLRHRAWGGVTQNVSIYVSETGRSDSSSRTASSFCLFWCVHGFLQSGKILDRTHGFFSGCRPQRLSILVSSPRF